MFTWLLDSFRSYPELAIFLTLALGFWVGNMKWGGFSVGVVTATLLAGVLVGQMRIEISSQVKGAFYMMFLFAIGYGVGPQFFNGLKKDGVKLVMITAMLCGLCLLLVYGVAKIAGLDVGQTAGLFAGVCAKSAALGVSTDTIESLPLSPELKASFLDAVPVAYALSYVYGTAGTAWILSSLGPKILGINLREECARFERESGRGSMSGLSAYTRIVARAYRVTNPTLVGQPISALEQKVATKRIIVLRVRDSGGLHDATPETAVESGAVLAVVGPRGAVLEHATAIGPEVNDRELLDVPSEILDVVITAPAVIGLTLQQLADADGGRLARGVYLRKLIRAGAAVPYFASTKLDRGDVVQVAGPTREVERVVQVLGYADRATERTDIVFMGLGIVAGALLGTLTFTVGGVPVSLTTSGGALIGGLVCGWLRSVNRWFGRIPEPALWVFNNVGLNVFIAIIGLDAGPSFVAGVRHSGVKLVLCGVVATTIPLLLTVFMGRFLKMNPAVFLGACAGGRSANPALSALEQQANSGVPRLGYSVPYAVGSVLLTTGGSVIVYMMT